MGAKDITEKILADYEDVFADIINGVLFDGEQVLHENELVNVKDKSQYNLTTRFMSRNGMSANNGFLTAYVLRWWGWNTKRSLSHTCPCVSSDMMVPPIEDS